MREPITLKPNAFPLSDYLPKESKISTLQTALYLILDCVDYTSGSCLPNEMVGAVLPKEIIESAKRALENSHEK